MNYSLTLIHMVVIDYIDVSKSQFSVVEVTNKWFTYDMLHINTDEINHELRLS